MSSGEQGGRPFPLEISGPFSIKGIRGMLGWHHAISAGSLGAARLTVGSLGFASQGHEAVA